MPRETTIPSQTLVEEIQSLQEYPEEKRIRVIVGSIDDKGQFVVPQQFRIYVIQNEDYDELLSANPSWNPGKPAGTYFNNDLWHFIDKQN